MEFNATEEEFYKWFLQESYPYYQVEVCIGGIDGDPFEGVILYNKTRITGFTLDYEENIKFDNFLFAYICPAKYQEQYFLHIKREIIKAHYQKIRM